MDNENEERLWGKEEVMKYLGISKTSYYRLMAQEEIPCAIICSKPKFMPEQVKAWFKKKSLEKRDQKRAKKTA